MRVSIRTKIALGIIASAAILSGVSITVSSKVISSLIDSHFKNKAMELAHTVTLITDTVEVTKVKSDIVQIYNTIDNKVLSDQWGSQEFIEYIEKFSSISRNAVFKSIHNTLHAFQAANNVDSVYLCFLDPENKTVVYMVDASDDPCPPGCIDSLYINPINLQILDNPEIGFPPYITNTDEYGWLVTAGVPIYEGRKVLCYAMVDISVEEIRRQQHNFRLSLSLTLFAITIVICIITFFSVHIFLTKPIKSLADAAVNYCNEASATEHSLFSQLTINSNDEIQELADAMKQMEKDLNSHIKNLLETTQELHTTRQKADLMTKLAQKDALTGVRNKTAYLNEIKNIDEKLIDGFEEFGIAMIDMNFLKQTNDEYGHENGDIALKNLCHHICTVFNHSPVFRIGGDEFAVILKNDDFKQSSVLKKQFCESLSILNSAKNHPWEKPSAAIGIAVYDKDTDNSVEDVFKRADDAMYQHKKEMKAERI